MSEESVVYIVDDDAAVRESVGLLAGSVGLTCQAYPSAEAFLEGYAPEFPGCLVLELHLLDMTGLQLQAHLVHAQIDTPIIFLSASASMPTMVRAMRQGAFDVLQKPYDRGLLLGRIQDAIHQHTLIRHDRRLQEETTARLDHLSRRERQILEHIVMGQLNREIAESLGVGVKTIEKHRGNLMHKMQARTPADLVRMYLIAGLPYAAAHWNSDPMTVRDLAGAAAEVSVAGALDAAAGATGADATENAPVTGALARSFANGSRVRRSLARTRL